MKRPFAVGVNEEAHGPDNVVYYIEDKIINICFCEAKFVTGASNAKSKLLEDINGDNLGKKSHISNEFLNEYIAFMLGNNLNIDESDKILFNEFIDELNSRLDNDNNFVDSLIKLNVCCNFIFFAIFDSTKKEPDKLMTHYDSIYNDAELKIKSLGINNYKIEVIFIPTDSKPIIIKEEIRKNYE